MYLKKYIIYIYISVIGLFLFFSFFNKNRNLENNISNFKNDRVKTQKFLDAIEPPCGDIKSRNIKKNIDKLEIIIPDSKKWNKNLFRALTAKSKNMILKKYKKRFNGIISFYDGTNLCKSSAKIRLSGGRKDHIEIREDKIVSSLDINLENGNINGITKFKLFLPKSRNYESEIITSLLLRKLGFISPRTFFVEVNLNNNNYKMILQEKAAKEMLEFHKLRESALLGINNNLLYELRSKGNRLNDPYMSSIFPELINHQWASKNEVSSEVSFNAMRHFTKSFQNIWSKNLDEFISFSDYDLSNNNQNSLKNLEEFRLILIAIGGEHSLWNNNRKFYFDPLSNSLLPIYYDGNSKIGENYKLNNLKINSLFNILFNKVKVDNALKLIRKLNIINKEEFLNELKNSNVDISFEEVEIIFSNIKNNLNLLKNKLYEKEFISISQNKEIQKAPHFFYKKLPSKFGIAFSKDKKNYLLCNINKKNCFKKNLNFKENIKLLNSKYNFENYYYYYVGDDYKNYVKGVITKDNTDFKIFEKNDLFFYYQGSPLISVDYDNKILNFNLMTNNDKFLFLGSNLINWKIKINSNIDQNKLKNRFDKNLITGLLTIKDSKLSNIFIDINGGIFEDGLNIINSSGNINEIIVSNSFQDAIDFDYSNLKVRKIKVLNAGNDCLDLSGGNYEIENLSAQNCSDKGISVGEMSISKINELFINNVYIGFVAKDSSSINIDNGEIKNYKICSAVYRKKQEFNGALIKASNTICPNEDILIQKNSYYLYK